VIEHRISYENCAAVNGRKASQGKANQSRRESMRLSAHQISKGVFVQARKLFGVREEPEAETQPIPRALKYPEPSRMASFRGRVDYRAASGSTNRNDLRKN
jgi:hypothetical protein